MKNPIETSTESPDASGVTHATSAFCIDCAYPLTQLEAATRRCPECGRAFNPIDPATVIINRSIPDSMRWALRPARWLYPAVRVVVILALLADVFLAGVIVHAWIMLGLIWLPLGIIYYAQRKLRSWVVWHYRQSRALLKVDNDQKRRSRQLLTLTVILLLFRVPFYAVFLPSLHWLNKVAHEEYAVRPYDSYRPRLTFIGLMPVYELSVNFGGVTIFTGLGQLDYHETFDNKHWWEFRDLVGLPW
jgi:hypothetical protein